MQLEIFLRINLSTQQRLFKKFGKEQFFHTSVDRQQPFDQLVNRQGRNSVLFMKNITLHIQEVTDRLFQVSAESPIAFCCGKHGVYGAQHSSQRLAQINSPRKNEIQYGVRNSCYPGGIDLGALCISRFDGDFRYCRRRPGWSRSLAGVIIPQAR